MTVVHDLAHRLHGTLAYGCERIAVAGSIRRGKPNPKDIEIVCIPCVKQRQDTDMFGNLAGEMVIDNLLDATLRLLLFNGEWDYDRILKRNGPKYKRLRHIESGACCDLFIVTLDTWGAQLVIRTGPAEFSHELVTLARRRGMQQDDGRLWRTHRDGTRDVVPTPDEQAYFAALGLAYIEPIRRTLTALKAQAE